MENQKKIINSRFIDVLLILLLAFVVIYELFGIVLTENQILSPIADMTVTRFCAGFFFLIIALRQGYRLFLFEGGIKTFLKNSVIIFPCVLVVINNLPIISLIKGEAAVTSPWNYVLLFSLQCVAIGFFEEIAFRGLFFLIVLKGKQSSRLSVFVTVAASSIVFGMYHLFNLLEGAGFVPTIMQVGYSALIGAMCAMVLLQTGNIVLPIVLHAVFDFCGGLVPTLGSGEIWNTPTVIITAILAVAVFLYMFYVFMKYDLDRIDGFYSVSEE